jgi:adenylosuccinate synthase
MKDKIGSTHRGIAPAYTNKYAKEGLRMWDLINPKDENLKQTGLKMQSTIKVIKIATLDQAVILGKIGDLDTKNMRKVKKILKIYFNL